MNRGLNNGGDLPPEFLTVSLTPHVLHTSAPLSIHVCPIVRTPFHSGLSSSSQDTCNWYKVVLLTAKGVLISTAISGVSKSRGCVQELFENVKKEEFKIPDGDSNLAETFFNPEREGWLTKEGGKYKSRHKRWFILKEGMLYYFKQPTVSGTYVLCRCRLYCVCVCVLCRTMT